MCPAPRGRSARATGTPANVFGAPEQPKPIPRAQVRLPEHVLPSPRYCNTPGGHPTSLPEGGADQTDVVEDADDVPLGTPSMGEHRGITRFGITALGAGSVDIHVVVVTPLSAGGFRTWRTTKAGPGSRSKTSPALRWATGCGPGRHPTGCTAKGNILPSP